MANAKGRYAGLLRDLAPHTPNLYIDRSVVRARELYEVPVNELNLPNRRELLRMALGICGVEFAWKGYFDVHHVGWPYGAYRELSTEDFESVGESYRDLGAVKVRVPRQMHDYFHAGFSAPPVPDEDVMVEYLAEDMRIRTILRTLLPDRDERIGRYIDPTRELARYAQYLDELDTTKPSQVGHLPDIEHLATLGTGEARDELRELISILKFDPADSWNLGKLRASS